MTNKEIKDLCLRFQKEQGGNDYPDYKFKVTQTKTIIKIYWEYLDGEYWELYKNSLMVANEYGELMNDYFDYNDTLENTLQSILHYMVTRY